MDAYWSLCEYLPSERRKGYALLRKQISEKPEEIEYALNRLIRGLGSDRKCARIGYYSALYAILCEFDTGMDGCALLKLMEKAIPLASSKEEYTNGAIGRLLCITCILNADVLKEEEFYLRTTKQLLTMMAKVDRRLFFECAETICCLIGKANEIGCLSPIRPLIREELPREWEKLSERTCILLLCVLCEYKEMFKGLSSNWYPKFFQTLEPNIFSFLTGLKKPLPVKGFEMAFDCAIKCGRLKEAWDAFYAALELSKKEPIEANSEYVFLKTVEYLAKRCSSDHEKLSFILSSLDLRQLYPSTRRNKAVSSAAIMELAQSTAQLNEGMVEHAEKFITQFQDSTPLLCALLYKLRESLLLQKKEEPLGWLVRHLLVLACEKQKALLTSEECRSQNLPLFFCLVDQLSRTIRCFTRMGRPIDGDIAKQVICNGFLTSEDDSASPIGPASKLANLKTAFRNCAYEMLLSELSSPDVDDRLFSDGSKSYRLLEILGGQEKLSPEAGKIFACFRPLFKKTKKRCLPDGLDRCFLITSWCLFLHALENGDPQADELIAMIPHMLGSKEDSEGLPSWTVVLTDIFLKVLANSSYSVLLLVRSLYKLISPFCDNETLSVLLTAVLEQHEQISSIDTGVEKTGDALEEAAAESAEESDGDINLSDVDDGEMETDAELAQKFRLAMKEQKKRPVDVTFKLRCVELIGALLSSRSDLVINCLPQIMKIARLPKSSLPSAVSDRMKKLIHSLRIQPSKGDSKQPANNVSAEQCVEALCNCLDQISDVRKASEEVDLVTTSIKPTVSALCKCTEDMSDALKSPALRQSLSQVVERFFNGKSDLLSAKSFLDEVKKMSDLCPMLLEMVCSACASADSAKPFTVNASAFIVLTLLSKDTAGKVKQAQISQFLRDYMIWLFEQCLRRGKVARQCRMFFRVFSRLNRIGILEKEDEKLILSVVEKGYSERSDAVGAGFKNRCLSVIDVLRRRQGLVSKRPMPTENGIEKKKKRKREKQA